MIRLKLPLPSSLRLNTECTVNWTEGAAAAREVRGDRAPGLLIETWGQGSRDKLDGTGHQTVNEEHSDDKVGCIEGASVLCVGQVPEEREITEWSGVRCGARTRFAAIDR